MSYITVAPPCTLYQDCKWDFLERAELILVRCYDGCPSSLTFSEEAHSYTLQHKGPSLLVWKVLSKVTMMSTRPTIWSISSCKTLFIRCKLTPRLLHTQTNHSSTFSAFSFESFIFLQKSTSGNKKKWRENSKTNSFAFQFET